MFVRIIRGKGGDAKEILVNTDHVWKIEIQYAVPGEPDMVGGKQVPIFCEVSLKDAVENPKAVRFYKVFVGSEVVTLQQNPDDPVVKVFEKIYRDALKA